MEVRSLRECNGAVEWLAKESRPDRAVQVSLSLQALSDPQVRHCRQANAMVRRARQHHELMWRFLPVPLENFRLVMHTGSTVSRSATLQCIVDAKSLYDHLVSPSSPSSVEDKRCGFDLVISRQCMQRLPPIVNLLTH